MHKFGELEAVIMDRLWARTGSTTVRDLVDELQTDREIAYTTVMSTMDNLHHKDWLARERDGRAFRYWPTVTREEYSARLMRQALSGSENPSGVFTHFIQDMSAEESDVLRQLLDGRKRGQVE